MPWRKRARLIIRLVRSLERESPWNLFPTMLLPLVQIIEIDLPLSGDNAIVIALACRELRTHQRKLGMALGAGTAIILRILFALFITYLLVVPYLKIIGGILLLGIGTKLAVGEGRADQRLPLAITSGAPYGPSPSPMW